MNRLTESDARLTRAQRRYVLLLSIEERILPNHPLRRIRKMADQALAELYGTFELLYASEGRPSVPPEQLLLASLLQAFYGLRSERLLLEQLNYNLLFRWFVGLSPDDPIWHPTTFTKNRERLLNKEVMGAFLDTLLGLPEVKAHRQCSEIDAKTCVFVGFAAPPLLQKWSGDSLNISANNLVDDHFA
jgi:transposase